MNLEILQKTDCSFHKRLEAIHIYVNNELIKIRLNYFSKQD